LNCGPLHYQCSALTKLSYGTLRVEALAPPSRISCLLIQCINQRADTKSTQVRGLDGHDPRKEVFQPHLPVRLPCYDLAPVTSFTLGRSSRLRTSGTPGSHGLTGGVYKARERIHRVVADTRLLANPTSRSRVADSDPNWDRLWRFAPPRGVAALCTGHCNTCVAPDVRAVLI
jgi:hypothetical protein